MSFVLDPFSTLVQLALLSFKDNGVKIGIVNNTIVFFENTKFDIAYRSIRYYIFWQPEYSRDCLFNLQDPIERAVEYYDLPLLFDLAYRGLEKLKNNYRDSKSGNARSTIESTMKCLRRTRPSSSPVQGSGNEPRHASEPAAPLRTFWRPAEIDVVMLLFRLLVDHPDETYRIQLITNCLKGRETELLPLLQLPATYASSLS